MVELKTRVIWGYDMTNTSKTTLNTSIFSNKDRHQIPFGSRLLSINSWHSMFLLKILSSVLKPLLWKESKCLLFWSLHSNHMKYNNLTKILKKKLKAWSSLTGDPFVCSPHSVLEDTGAYRFRPQCLPLFNRRRHREYDTSRD